MLRINDLPITKTDDVKQKFLDIVQNDKQFNITVSMDQKVALHHEKGIHIMYFDQLSTIADHLDQLNITNSRT